MPINPITGPARSMRAVRLIRQLTQEEKCALVRGFLLAVEGGLVDDPLLTDDQKEPMRELFPVIEKYWDGS